MRKSSPSNEQQQYYQDPQSARNTWISLFGKVRQEGVHDDQGIHTIRGPVLRVNKNYRMNLFQKKPFITSEIVKI